MVLPLNRSLLIAMPWLLFKAVIYFCAKLALTWCQTKTRGCVLSATQRKNKILRLLGYLLICCNYALKKGIIFLLVGLKSVFSIEMMPFCAYFFVLSQNA